MEDMSPGLPGSVFSRRRLQMTQYFVPVTVSMAVANPLASTWIQDVALAVAVVAQKRQSFGALAWAMPGTPLVFCQAKA
jgi:hypothetical protein